MIGKNENSLITISLCGDIFISKRLPGSSYPGFVNCTHFSINMNVDLPIWKLLFIKEKDTRKLFLEVGYAMADPACLCDLKRMGIEYI